MAANHVERLDDSPLPPPGGDFFQHVKRRRRVDAPLLELMADDSRTIGPVNLMGRKKPPKPLIDPVIDGPGAAGGSEGGDYDWMIHDSLIHA